MAKGRERGVTLLEVLLVLCLLSGAGFVLLVKLPVHFEKQRLNMTATQLLAEVRDVRQAALAENNWYEIKFYPQDGEHNYKVFRQGTRVRDISLEKGIQFIGQPGNLTFNAAGRGSGMTITLQNALGDRKSVVVSPVGMRIREE